MNNSRACCYKCVKHLGVDVPYIAIELWHPKEQTGLKLYGIFLCYDCFEVCGGASLMDFKSDLFHCPLRQKESSGSEFEISFYDRYDVIIKHYYAHNECANRLDLYIK